jgi:hypothetical protein
MPLQASNRAKNKNEKSADFRSPKNDSQQTIIATLRSSY